MACKGGCTNGAASIFHDTRGIQRVNMFSREALTDDPTEGIRGYDMKSIKMEREYPELKKDPAVEEETVKEAAKEEKEMKKEAAKKETAPKATKPRKTKAKTAAEAETTEKA